MANVDTKVDLARIVRKLEDFRWVEVEHINSYAVLMGYLSMAVRGTGLLVLTWTTVVLLGGFVSSLQKKDFWCLTAITFMQAVGIFDASSNKRLSYIGYSFAGIWASLSAYIDKDEERSEESSCGLLLHFAWGLAIIVAMPIQGLVIAIIVCPLFVLYVSGPYVPIWLGVWRLSHRDYVEGDGDASSANLTVALDVLYTLVVAQGVLVYYMRVQALATQLIVEAVANSCKFDKRARWSVGDYMGDTIEGCSKDPSFVGERNMITYAVDQINSGSADRKLSGARILDTLIAKIQIQNWDNELCLNHVWDKKLAGRHMVLKQLIVDSEDVVLKLLQMLDWRSPYDKEMRKRAARIVAYIAGGIHLKQYPQGIQWIASLLGTFQEYNDLEPYQRDWLLHTMEQDWTQQACLVYQEAYLSSYLPEDDDPEVGYRDLVLQALRILWRLAANEDNCKIMRNHAGLLSKAMAPVTNDLLHNHSVRDHDEWSSSVVEGSLRLMCQLVTAPGKTGKKLRSDISANNEAIRTMERILQCNSCGASLKDKAIQTLTELYMETPSSTENFMKTLLDIYKEEPQRRGDTFIGIEGGYDVSNGKPIKKEYATEEWSTSLLVIYKTETEEPDIIETAARALMRISLQMENSATILMQNADIINLLTTLLLCAKEKTYQRVAAAVVLERLCIYYNDLNNQKKNNMAKDLFLMCKHKLKEKLMTNEMTKILEEIDAYYLNSDQVHGLDHISKFMKRFIPAYLSLFVTVCEMISTYQDSVRLLGASATSVPVWLKNIVEKNFDYSTYNLRIMKLITKIVITTINLKVSYINQDLDSLMDSLSKDLGGMFTVDASMVFASTEDGAWRVRDSMLNRGEGQPFRSFRSLVEQAQKLVDERTGMGMGLRPWRSF